ncbi:MAG TPA: LemA family protein [Oceanospirillaceae bacterium]|jgi:LemA protein|nr:LemA family protein [Oceanospirillaceae bacterium]
MLSMPSLKRLSLVLTLVISTLALSACGVNNIPTYDEQVKSAWSQVENQYQRRADLIPNLVSTVKGYAAHEKDTLTAVTNARAKVGSIQVNKNLLENPQAMQQFQEAQGQLGSALKRLLVVSERYPDLKANQNFLALQSQLEGTENRISVARRDYITATERFNTEIRTFPGKLWHSFLYSDLKLRDVYTATTQDAETAPKVSF